MTLYNGNCLRFLSKIKNESVDLIVTDPPYKVISGGQTQTAQKFAKHHHWKNDGKIFEHNDFVHSYIFLNLLYDKLKPNSHIYWFTNFLNLRCFLNDFNDSKFKMHSLLVWDKSPTAVMNRWYLKNAEYVIFARKGKAKTINMPGSKTIHNFKIPKNKHHPTEKPVDLLRMYVENSSSPGDVVFDPFMGSGSTGVACAETNRRFVGIEIDPKFFEIAKSRLK